MVLIRAFVRRDAETLPLLWVSVHESDGGHVARYGQAMREPPPAIEPKTDYFLGFPLALYDNARWLVHQEMYAAAVLVAQAAVEMGARHAFIRLIRHDRRRPLTDEELHALPNLSFMEVETRRLWTTLIGGLRVTRPRDPPVWQAYHQHVEYRNRIAHGDVSGDSRAYESVVAAGAFILRLDEQMQAFDLAHPRDT